MADRPSADRTAELLLWFGREPSRYGAEGRRRDAPSLDPEVILKLALGRRVDFLDPTLREPEAYLKLRQAATAYIRHMFFRQDASPYQTLGLEPGASQGAIRESFRLLMHLVHPDRQGASRQWPDACAAAANRAYAVLRDPDARSRLEHEAEARAALARAIYKAASAAEATRMPVVIRPKKSRGLTAGALAQRALPEWLTAGVVGYVRRNPAVGAFIVLFAGAVIFVGATVWDGHDGMLVRVARAPRVSDATALESSPARGTSSHGTPASADPARPQSAPPVPERAVAMASPVPDRRTEIASSMPRVDSAPAIAVVREPRAPEPSLSQPEPPVAAPTETVATVRAEPVPAIPALATVGIPPATAEIEALFATLVETYERGQLDAFAALFDDDADTNLRHGRAAIRGEYDELFRLSQWRKMQLMRVNWRRVGDRALAKGEIMVRIAWKDGREVEQRLNVDMELMRRDGRVVIARLMHQPKAP